MPDAPTSSSFMRLYEALPPEARQQLVEKRLAPLLDHVSRERGKKVLKSATQLRMKYDTAPDLNIRVKKREINALVDELVRDAKRSIVKERSRREELMEEIVESITEWLNDIWSVVFEYKINFEEAHRCLLFLADVLDTLTTIPTAGQCRCSINHHKITIEIRRKRKVIKNFTLSGPRRLDRVLLWIWRDLFVCMFFKNRGTENIPNMLTDIEDCLSWEALEQLLYGGSSSTYDDEDGEESDEESDREQEFGCPCRLHGSHWSQAINEHHTSVRDLVLDHLTALFETAPSHKLYSSILSISPTYDETEEQLQKTVTEIAGCSADTLVAALDIHTAEGNPIASAALLNEHSYLLRPRDANILQTAVASLAELSSLHPLALQIAERELLDTAAAIRVAIRSAFCKIEDKIAGPVLTDIGKLRVDTAPRRQRIDSWVDSVITPGSGTTHPMAFAAMMLGFPFAPGMEDGDETGDMVGFLDLDPGDPDLEDLREEFRPRLRERFESWVSTVGVIKGGGSALLNRVYHKIVEEMPYFKHADVVNEMMSRIGERPSKAHIADGMDAVLDFCKAQRKKLVAMAEKRRKKEAAKKAAAASSPPADDSDGPPPLIPLSNLVVIGPPSTPTRTFGGMNDVD
ncbi:hypothetical protein MIND_00667100 [Mycena indigotica]|uniref:Uncharacterized protein n=1 Tax=Mycena indigotica TaxID=2126181 RepID=A0A8H6SK05_9AGAR|nr:uncharacterized protein MIND_00667100 [Mycena indigotica]KAF7301033.1 hypothetical protein MIND_00667100 [Mycena indigotica]